MSFLKNKPTSRKIAMKIPAELSVKERQEWLQSWKKGDFKELFAMNFDLERAANHNCENLLGSISLPLGIAGPLLSKSAGKEEFLVPLATSEAALVASVNRGLKAIYQAGGVKLSSERKGMTRAPVYAFPNSQEASQFLNFFAQEKQQKEIQRILESTSGHLHYLDWQAWRRARFVFLRYRFDTEEAMGMNMVSIALQTLYEQFLIKYPNLKMISLSSNLCVDKKSSVLNQLLGRGYAAEAEVFIPEKIIHSVLKTDSTSLLQVHHLKNLIGSNMAGSFSQNMQVANVAAAFFIATGQDPAHVVEASQASLLIEAAENYGEKGLSFVLSHQNINLASLGGGTWLPAQRQARELIGREKKELKAQKLAEIFLGAALAAEISGLAALSGNALAQAHQKLARGNGIKKL